MITWVLARGGVFNRDLLDRKCPFSENFFLSYQKVKQYVEIMSIQVSSASIATIYLFRRESDKERLAIFIPLTTDSRDTKKNIHLRGKQISWFKG